MSPEATDALQHAFARYDAATAQVAAARRSDGAPPSALCELRQARIALCAALEACGWEPPAEVRLQLLHDRNQLACNGMVLVA